MILRYLIPFILIGSPALVALGETFPSAPRAIATHEAVTVRGVINSVILPVPDEAELDATQSGYFLFTSETFSVKGEDAVGDTVRVADQTFFHLIIPENRMGPLQGLLGKPVEITATALFAHTRYHRTPVLLQLQSVRALH